MAKQEYIENQIVIRVQKWIGSCCMLGALLFLFLGLLDYYAFKIEYFYRFIGYRLIISLLLFMLYIANKRHSSSWFQYPIIMIGTILSAATIELMIFALGGHKSFYYAGMGLIIMVVLGFIPLEIVFSAVLAAIVYLIYVLPIVLSDTITDWPYFISSNFFLVSTMLIALTWRFLSQKSLINELSLQYNLSIYSSQLEALVSARTKELRKSEQWHRSLYETAMDGILVLDAKGTIINANQKAVELYQTSQEAFIGTKCSLFSNESEITSERLGLIISDHSVLFETMVENNNRKIIMEANAKEIFIDDEMFIQVFLRDITEKKKSQEQLYQSQKMDSIGNIASGVAHDFNNVLTAVIANVDLLKMKFPDDEYVLRRLNVINNATMKGQHMISQILGFARKHESTIVPISLNSAVLDVVSLLERTLEQKDIRVQLDLAENLPAVDADFYHMQQVIMNLMVNAKDAMTCGTITIRTSFEHVPRNAPDVPSFITPGDYVMLRIADTGTGVPEEIIDKIFEPFFTTKEQGKGTGLGLSMVYGVIKGLNGYITVSSKRGSGACFNVYLPPSKK